jgi:L-asparaginase
LVSDDTIKLKLGREEGSPLSRLRLIAMGGTIAFTDSPRGAVPSLSAVELAQSAQTEDEISSIDVAGISSIGITEEHLQLLVSEIKGAIADGYDGLVVSHGTDTLEESAYLSR